MDVQPLKFIDSAKNMSKQEELASTTSPSDDRSDENNWSAFMKKVELKEDGLISTKSRVILRQNLKCYAALVSYAK